MDYVNQKQKLLIRALIIGSVKVQGILPQSGGHRNFKQDEILEVANEMILAGDLKKDKPGHYKYK